MIKSKYYVYLLKSEVCNRFYVGYTIDTKRRLLEHNGIIKNKGAKKTRYHRPWKLIMYISFPYERTALQYEFMIQHPPKRLRKRGSSILKYMTIMKKLLQQEKICSTAPLNSELKLIRFFTEKKYYQMWKNI